MRGFKLLGAVCAVSMTIFAANDVFVGTWKLNPQKSKFAAGTAMTDESFTFSKEGDQWKRTATGTDPDGKPIEEDSTIAWDGKDHAIDEPGMTVAVNILNEHSIKFTIKHEGKIIMVGRLVVSKDGRAITAYAKGTDEKGRKIDNVEIYDKQ
jgi:hypothetical protein